MIIALLADALAQQPARLELNLVCEGQYEDIETSTGTTGGMVGDEYRTRTTVLRTPVMKPGIAHITFQDGVGQLTYPDGTQRALSNVVADPRQITAEYQRKALLFTFTWKVEVNRMTGAVRIATSKDVAFAGTCRPESTQPKF